MKKMLLPIALASFTFSTNAISGDYLTADEVKALITNKTAYGNQGFTKKKIDRYFDASGKSSGIRGVGTWRVDNDGQLCQTGSAGSSEKCRAVKKDGDVYKKYLIINKPNKPHKQVATYTKIVDGNPENFKLAE
jgi:hypothetical protein